MVDIVSFGCFVLADFFCSCCGFSCSCCFLVDFLGDFFFGDGDAFRFLSTFLFVVRGAACSRMEDSSSVLMSTGSRDDSLDTLWEEALLDDWMAWFAFLIRS